MMLDEARSASRHVTQIISVAVNEVAFGPTEGFRQAGLLFALGGQHLVNASVLMNPEQHNGWVSGHALARVSGECCLRAIYLLCCEKDRAYETFLQRFLQGKPSPFGKFDDLIPKIRKGVTEAGIFERHWPGVGIDGSRLAQMIVDDWNAMNAFTHGGEFSTRIYRQAVRTQTRPDELSSLFVLKGTHLLAQTATVMLAWASKADLAVKVATETQNRISVLLDAFRDLT